MIGMNYIIHINKEKSKVDILSILCLYTNRKQLVTPAQKEVDVTTYTTFKQLKVPSLEALQLFCKATCARGGFHPLEFQSRITETEKVGFRRHFTRHIRIEATLQTAYEAALIRHNNSNPGGPIPKRITSQKGTIRYSLKWKESGTIITLTFLRQDTFLAVTGLNLDRVAEYATRLRLPEPVAQEIRHSQHLTETHLIAQSWRDVSIPLGDIIDFVNRYRK